VTDDLILAIDCGTQSIRAIVFDGRGELVSRAQIDIEPYFSDHPGWAEQRAEYFWEQLCAATRALWAQGVVDPAAIRGLALTTQRATVVHVDRAGHALRPAITWLDQRRTEGLAPLGGAWGLMFKAVGASALVRRFQENAEAMWVARNQPEIAARTHKVLLLSGYLTRRLVGEFVDSVAAQVGYIPFDVKRFGWAGPRDWKWKVVGITRAQLPRLVPPAQRLGVITRAAAADTGIPEGTPMIAAAADKACEVLGCGGVEPEIACLSFGTTATINTTTRRYLEIVRPVPPYPAAIPGAYNTELMIYRGFWMVRWFRDEFGLRERQLAADQEGVTPEQLFDELVRDIPAGSLGLTLQPYWSPGIPEPGAEAKGAVIGFGDVHTRAHFYRAILEGLVYGLRAYKEQIERRSGVPIRSLRIAGGGSRSDVAMQVSADVFGMPAARPHTSEASALGAAIDGAVGVGIHANFERAIEAMTRTGAVFYPQAKEVALYDELYSRVYTPMYGRLQPLYRAIPEITGYPS
jgi:sugar (pentulose or hexulose) kinase